MQFCIETYRPHVPWNSCLQDQSKGEDETQHSWKRFAAPIQKLRLSWKPTCGIGDTLSSGWKASKSRSRSDSPGRSLGCKVRGQRVKKKTRTPSCHLPPTGKAPTCEGDGAGKNSPPNKSIICSSATSLVGVTFGGGGTGGPFLSCQHRPRRSNQIWTVCGTAWSHIKAIHTFVTVNAQTTKPGQHVNWDITENLSAITSRGDTNN